MTVTMLLPCYAGPGAPPDMHSYSGEVVGSFFIHHRVPDRHSGLVRRGDWMVSHVATGYSVGGLPRSKARAVRLAKELEKLNCWQFSSPCEAKQIPKDLLTRIAEIKGRV